MLRFEFKIEELCLRETDGETDRQIDRFRDIGLLRGRSQKHGFGKKIQTYTKMLSIILEIVFKISSYTIL